MDSRPSIPDIERAMQLLEANNSLDPLRMKAIEALEHDVSAASRRGAGGGSGSRRWQPLPLLPPARLHSCFTAPR